jgi:hypothetical protein
MGDDTDIISRGLRVPVGYGVQGDPNPSRIKAGAEPKRTPDGKALTSAMSAGVVPARTSDGTPSWQTRTISDKGYPIHAGMKPGQSRPTSGEKVPLTQVFRSAPARHPTRSGR